MPDENQAVEDYLRTFRGPEPREDLVPCAMLSARKRQSKRLWLGSSMALAAGAVIALLFSLRAPVDRKVSGPALHEQEWAALMLTSDTVDCRSLKLAYKVDGIDGLTAQLDRASGRITPVTEIEKAGITAPIWQP
jgi:hypothetical protein